MKRSMFITRSFLIGELMWT